jgi:hypothetical protein
MATSWHLTSLTVLGGTLHGKKLAIEDVVVEVLIGSDPDCHLHLDLPTVSPIHARLWIEPDDVTVYGTRSGPGVFVNFDRIDGDGKLRPGDLLWLGPPQAAGSVMLQVHFEERDTLPPVAVSPLADEETPAEVEALAPAAEAVPIPLSVSVVEPMPAEVKAQASAEAKPDAPDEELGVLPEDAPTPLQIALHAEVAPVSEPAPPSGFEDFLVMDSAASSPPPVAASADEFVVSGFEAEWPEASQVQGVAASLERPAPVPASRPDPPPPASEDAFFIDVGAQPPPAAFDAESHGGFFIDDGIATSPAAPVAPPAPTPSRVAPPRDEDLSFAAAFLEEPPPQAKPPVKAPVKPPAPTPRPAAPAPPPVAKPAPAPKPAPVPRPSEPAPPKPSPAVSPAVAPSAPPSRPPSATGAVRPLPRPDVSQSIARGDRPSVPRPDRTQVLRPRPPARPLGRYAVLAVITLVVLGGIGFAVSTLMRGVRLEKVEPQRARVGETVALVGAGFASAPGDNVVLFDDKPASVTAATATRLDVVVPDVAPSGSDVKVAVRVRVGRAESMTVALSVFSGPVLHGISPDVAMPGDEVVLAGSGWGLGPSVRFGGLSADVMEARETSIRVRVPAIDGGPGTSAPVVVSSGLLESNPGPFYVGHIPLVTKAEPTSVAPGEVVTLSGRGFRRERSQNAVQVGGVRALVVAAFDSEIKVVVPRVPPGSRVLEVRVPSSVAPAQVPLVVGGAAEALDFHFVAEPFEAVPGRDHAVLATSLGPAFVLASSGGRSAAERALEAARRLNEAASALKATPELTVELRDADSKPSLGLIGRPELLVDVTDEDAVAYAEDWTGLRGRGGAVTSGRLGKWWEAVARDLVLLLVRGARPHFAADLAPEGRALVDFFQASEHGGGLGASTKPPLRDALRLIALRVPPGVRGPAVATPVAAPSPAVSDTPTSSSAQPMPRLEGPWTGTETEGARQRYVTVTFRGATGTLAYEGAMTVSTPLLSVDQPQRGVTRFSVELRGGLRYYVGRWEGQALSGKISTDPGGSQSLGTFELRPR